MTMRHSIVPLLGLVLLGMFAGAASAQESVANAVLAKSDTPVSFVSWNSDGKSFATTWNNSVILWDAESNTIASVFSGHNGPIKVVRFSRDGKWLLTLGLDNAVVVRDLDFTVGETRVAGNGFLPVNDAVFVDNGNSIILPLDGVNTSHYYRLRLTQQFVSRTIAESAVPIQSLDITKDGTKLLIAAQDGTVTLLDLTTNRTIGVYPRFAASHVPPRFSPDGTAFIAAADRNSLVISPVGGNGAFTIRDSGQPVNSVVFNADGTRIAVALRDGSIKIFDTQNGNEIKWFSVNGLQERDVVNSLSFSPDGDFLIAGTEAGYILRWSITGKVFVPARKRYLDRDIAAKIEENLGEETEDPRDIPIETQKEMTSAGEGNITINVPDDGIEITLTANTLNSNYYYGSFGLGGSYRNYKLYPLYWGAGLELAAGIPNGDYPFTAGYVNGTRLNDPWLYSASLFGCFGLCYYLPNPDLLVFTEMRGGANAKVLYNNELIYYFVGDPVFGGQLDVLMGVQWKFLRASIGGEYDANFGFLAKATLAGVIKLKSRNKKGAEAPVEETNTPEEPAEAVEDTEPAEVEAVPQA